MTSPTAGLILDPDASIDLHMHTTYSDGRWPAQQLIEFLANGGFDLVAITDHDRVDKVAEIQRLGAEKQLPVLAGVEMSTDWHGKMGDVLCYGFDPTQNYLQPLIERIVRLQLENTYEVHEELLRKGYSFPKQDEILDNRGQLRQPSDNIRLLVQHGLVASRREGLQIIQGAGYRSIKAEMAETVEAAHRSGAVCLIAHPGRREPGFTYYDLELLDQVRREIPIDGFELYHPTHQQASIEAYKAYAEKHDLLISTGSDSHSIPERMPRKHRAEISQKLLERLGIHVTSGTNQS